MIYPIINPPGDVDFMTWTAVVNQIRDHCGWHIAPWAEESVTLDGPGGRDLQLPTLRLVELISISNDGHVVSNPEWSTTGCVRGGWTSRLRGVEATMLHGFDAWPADLSAIVSTLVATSARPGIKAITNRSHQVTFDSSLTQDDWAVLDKYRLRAEP